MALSMFERVALKKLSRTGGSMIFYRYENIEERVREYNFYLVKETPGGYWIDVSWEGNKWVSKTSRKRFAYPTKELAMESFKARKNRQIILLTAQLENAKKALINADRIKL